MVVEIYWFAIVLIVFSAIWIFLYLNLKKAIKQSSSLQERLNSQSFADNHLFLKFLAREYANELIRRDSAFYLNRFHDLFQEWQDLRTKDPEYKTSTLRALYNEYEYYSDFAKVGSRDRAHIVNTDAFQYCSDEKLWEIYRAIRLFQALSDDIGLFKDYNSYDDASVSIDREELDHLKVYLVALKEVKLLKNLREARDEFYYSRDTFMSVHNTKKFRISYVALPFAAVPFGDRIGVYVRDLDLYGYWEDCTPDDKTFTTYYVSDDEYYLTGRELSEFDLSNVDLAHSMRQKD